MTCGCRIAYEILGEPSLAGNSARESIVFCPLHQAAEELREAVKAQHSALDWCLAMIASLDRTFYPSKSPAWKAVVQGNEALTASAEGTG